MRAARTSAAIVGQGGDEGLLLGRGADAGHRDRRLGRAAGLDEGVGGLADAAHAGEQDERAVVGVRAPVDLLAAGDDGHLLVALGGQRDAGVGRDRAHRGDAGDDLEADAGLHAGLRLLGAGGVEERVAGHQAHHALLLAVAYDDLGAGRVGQRLAVLTEAAVDDLRAVLALGQAEDGADQGDVLGGLGHDDLGALDQLHGAHRQQTGVTGSTADERHPTRGRPLSGAGLRGLYSRHACCFLTGGAASIRSAAPSSSIELARRVPSCSASVTGPVVLIRTERAPSSDRATARSHSSSPSSPSTTSASAPSGAEQPASRVARTARSAVTAARVAVSSSRAERGDQVGVVGAALDRERALAGCGQHLERVEDLGDLVEAAQAGQSGAGQDDRVDLALADLADPGVDVAADALDLQAEAERLELAHPARGAGAEAAADRQLAQGQAVAGDHDVAGVLAQRHRGERDAVGGRGGQVLERVDGDVDRARRAGRRAAR